MRTFVSAILVIAVQPVRAEDLTLDQRLIVACFNVRLSDVVVCLRKGADVNATLGERANQSELFYNRWEQGRPAVTSAWTPLIALAAASKYPEPTSDWPPQVRPSKWSSQDVSKSRALREQIPRGEIYKRQNDARAILYLLLSHNCDLDRDDGFGATALFKAVSSEKVELVEVLLEFGANPNSKTRVYIDGPGNLTPLHMSCRSSEMTRLLLKHGANPAAADSEGRTPADLVNLDPNREFDLVQTTEGWRVLLRNKHVK